jgi:CRP/FNR family transcriptional regulator, anaerobic regulatory protein
MVERTGLSESQFPFVARLGDEAQRELVTLRSVNTAPGSRLLRRGDLASGVYLVLRGSLRVYYITAEGREATLYRVDAGGLCLLSLTSTIDRTPYPAWVDAGLQGGDYIRIPSEAVHRLLDTESAFRQFVLGVLSGRVFDLMCVLEEVGSNQIEQRVARYLLRRRDSDDCVCVSQAGIASELGSAREVVFRALRSLAARKLIQTGRLKIRILDSEALARAINTEAPALLP